MNKLLKIVKFFIFNSYFSFILKCSAKDQFRQNAFGDESCRGLTMKAMKKRKKIK